MKLVHLLLSLLLMLVSTLHACLAHDLVNLELSLPSGLVTNITYVYPNETVFGYIVVESQVDYPLNCTLHVSTRGCTLLTESQHHVYLARRFDAKLFYVEVKIRESSCTVVATLRCNGYAISKTKVLIPRAENTTADLILPSDSLCRFNAKIEKYVLVVKPSNPSPIIRLVTGEEKSAHPDFLGYACVRVSSPGVYTAVLVFKKPSGELAPISTTSLVLEESKATQPGIIVLSGFSRYIVFPLFAWADPRDLVGTYYVELFLYPYGASKPILHKVYTIRIIVLDTTALMLILLAGLVAVPVFVYLSVYAIRRSELKEVLLCALIACLIFTTVVIPGHVIWSIASVLGPFDWTVYGIVYNTLRTLYYVVAISLRPKPGTFTLVMLIVWLLQTLLFGRLSILSLLWAATSALIYEPLLYIAGITRGRLGLARLLLVFTPAALLDNYVDLMLYMTLYRLYYADWYVVMYVIGTTAYSLVGAALGERVGRMMRFVVHE